MFSLFFKSRTISVLFIYRTLPFTQIKTLTYKTRIQRLYNDGIDLKQQSVEINSIERIRRCAFYKDVDLYSFYKATCPNVRTLGDALHEGYLTSKDGPCVGVSQSSPGDTTSSLK
jgi:hypothetical protein